MGEDEPEARPAVNEQDRGPEDIREEIEETREELGQTINALSERADVKSRARGRVSQLKGTISSKADGAKGKVQTAAPDSFDVDQARAGERRAAGRAQENATALAAGAFLVGLLVGRALGRRSA
jgi:hypothetical protein